MASCARTHRALPGYDGLELAGLTAGDPMPDLPTNVPSHLPGSRAPENSIASTLRTLEPGDARIRRRIADQTQVRDSILK